MTNDILVETGNVAKDYNWGDGTSVNLSSNHQACFPR